MSPTPGLCRGRYTASVQVDLTKADDFGQRASLRSNVLKLELIAFALRFLTEGVSLVDFRRVRQLAVHLQ